MKYGGNRDKTELDNQVNDEMPVTPSETKEFDTNRSAEFENVCLLFQFEPKPHTYLT